MRNYVQIGPPFGIPKGYDKREIVFQLIVFLFFILAEITDILYPWFQIKYFVCLFTWAYLNVCKLLAEDYIYFDNTKNGNSIHIDTQQHLKRSNG